MDKNEKTNRLSLATPGGVQESPKKRLVLLKEDWKLGYTFLKNILLSLIRLAELSSYINDNYQQNLLNHLGTAI